MTTRETDARAFELIERLGNLVRSCERERGGEHGLQPVHLQALWFISRSNRYSDTPGALAEYLGVTRGTTSSTLKVLRDRGFVVDRQDADDARVLRLSLTPAGERLQRDVLPPQAFTDALKTLSQPRRRELEDALTEVLVGLQRGAGARAFGVCHSCHHFAENAAGYQCGLTGEPLSANEVGLLCRDHQAA